MTNPYHDQNGRFCSSDEMYAAVKQLTAEGKTTEAFYLLSDYKKAKQKNLTTKLVNAAEIKIGDKIGVNSDELVTGKITTEEEVSFTLETKHGRAIFNTKPNSQIRVPLK